MSTVDLKFDDFSNFHKAFPTEKSCIKFLEKKRWPNGVVSPFDKDAKVYKRGDGMYRCGTTGKNFNVRVGTIFHGSKISLWKWFFAIYLITSRKKGISAKQLTRDISVTEKSAWLMLQKIRGTFAYDGDKLDGEIELDETFVGGKNAHRHSKTKMYRSRGRSHADKTAVMGMLQREGIVVCKVTGDTKAKSLTPHIKENIDKSAMLYIDDWQGYNDIKKEYNHEVVDHGSGEYVKGNAYTNNIEGFWGTFCKRAFSGCYNMCSGAHMHRYFDEFAFRYNTRKVTDKERFEAFFDNIEYQTTYEEIKNEFKERNRKRLARIHDKQKAKHKQQQEEKKKESAKAKRKARNKRYQIKNKVELKARRDAKKAAKQAAAQAAQGQMSNTAT